VRIRQEDLDAFLEAGEVEANNPPADANDGNANVAAPSPVENANGTDVTAWATFTAALADATAVLEKADKEELVPALESLADASRNLASALKAEGSVRD
jgi:hypothetical protein